MKNHFVKLCILIISIMIISVGCDKANNGSNKIAIISMNAESSYQKTFEDLSLGILFDFKLKLPAADKSWVDIWVEGYKDGEKIHESLSSLSYGLSPKQVEEGNMGFGIINPNSDEMQLFLYAPGVSSKPHFIDNDFLIRDGISGWDYAIGSEKVELELAEEKVLAVYRQSAAGDGMRTRDYQDLDSINEMIKEDKTVILLKIRVVDAKAKK